MAISAELIVLSDTMSMLNMVSPNNHDRMLEEIINQPSRFSILGAICAFKEPRIYENGVKTIDVHFETGKGVVLVEYKNSFEHKDYATIQLNCYADYMRIKPFRKVFVWGVGRVIDV